LGGSDADGWVWSLQQFFPLAKRHTLVNSSVRAGTATLAAGPIADRKSYPQKIIAFRGARQPTLDQISDSP
jgi:hypothetical protein